MNELTDIEITTNTDNIIELKNLEETEASNNSYKQKKFDYIKSSSGYDTLCAALDGLLLVHNKPITYEKLSQVLEISMEDVEQLVISRKKDYDDNPKCGIQIAILENGIQLATKAKISHFIQKLDGQKLVSLSLPALETLSVIAFKQPITKAEIDSIRGVDSGGVISNLLEKKLIYISGEKQVIGRPRLYSTTQDFLYYFGMNSLKELPVPTIDINEALDAEKQKLEQDNQKEVEKDFNISQGFVPIENDNESQEMVENENNGVDSLTQPTENNYNAVEDESNANIETQNTGE